MITDTHTDQQKKREASTTPVETKSLYRNTAVAGCDFYAPAQFVVGTRADIAKSKWNIILNKKLI